MSTSTFTVKINSLSYGGRGVGRREDGKVVFVPGVIPGESLLVQVDKEQSSYCTAEVIEILERSPKRIEPECPLFSVCGGCDWQHIAYSDQVYWKDAILCDEIKKALPQVDLPRQQPVPSRIDFGYRGHAILQCAYEPDFSLGFFMKRSNRVVEFDQCPVLNPGVQKIIGGLKRILRENPLPGLSSIEIHAPQEESILLARVEKTDPKKVMKVMEKIYAELDISGVSFAMLGPKRSDFVLGQNFCRYSLDIHGRQVHLSSAFGGFIQANDQVNTDLIEYVSYLASGSEYVLDLYSGGGNFSIPLSRVSSRVVGIEQSHKLVSQGKVSAKKNRAENVRFLAMDATRAVESVRDEQVGFDTVVLDPPREGAKDVARILPELKARRIIYISCNPSTLARDLKPLVQSGYNVKSVKLFDMFPQTYHIESVAYLER